MNVTPPAAPMPGRPAREREGLCGGNARQAAGFRSRMMTSAVSPFSFR